jgi:Ser/Thr protein kinase RdoA (MazF antagonist)
MTHAAGANQMERPDRQTSGGRVDGQAARPFPASLTILAAEALGKMVEDAYDVGAVEACKLLTNSLTHTYLIDTERAKYVVRVYRAGWRRRSDILYELDALRHLGRKGVPVSTPVARRDGSLVADLTAQEGSRPTALFTYAPGAMALFSEGYARRYGQAVAAVHNGLDDFESRHERFQLNLDYLLDQPLAAIRPSLRHRPDDWEYFEGLGEKLRERLGALPILALAWGFCHGDFHGGNAHQDAETITFFDFDCCGPGWRAYEIAVFRWNALFTTRNAKAAARQWTDFLEGYTAVRALGDLDLAAVPIFVAVRHIWWLGLQCSNAPDWGYEHRGDRFFDQALRLLKSWERKHLADKRARRQRPASRPVATTRAASP